MRAYQMTGRGGGLRESAVKWSGKNGFLSGKSQGISFQTKSGHPETADWIFTKLGRNHPYKALLSMYTYGSGPLHIYVMWAKNTFSR